MGLIFLILFSLIFLIIYTRLGSGNNVDSTNMITKLKSNKSNKKKYSLIRIIFFSVLLAIVILVGIYSILLALALA